MCAFGGLSNSPLPLFCSSTCAADAVASDQLPFGQIVSFLVAGFVCIGPANRRFAPARS